jgi:integrase/recombinase XerD
MIIKVENSNSFTTKNKKERIVPINKTLYNILIKRYPKIIDIKLNDYVFYRVKGISLNSFYVSKSFKKAVRKSGLDERIHFHSLRHSFASGLVQRGVSLYVVKELLGHQDITTTQIYSHIQNENLFDAVKTLDLSIIEKQSDTNK